MTIPGTLLGPVIAGSQDPAMYLGLGLWALGFHYFGFMHNNLCDLKHDKADPAKQHFPLVSGAIGERLAWRVWAAGTLLFYAVGIAIIVLGRGELLWSLAFLHAAILAGVAYNLASKRTRVAPFLIALSFASLPVYAFFAVGGAPQNVAVWYVFAYGFVLMLHQIAYSGYLKDLAPDPVNWLRNWGARAEEREEEGVYNYTFTPKVQAWGWFSRLLCPALAAVWMFSLGVPACQDTAGGTAKCAAPPGPLFFDPILVGLFLLFTLPLLAVFARLSKPGEFPRQRKVALMGTSEIFAYFLLVASLLPHIITTFTGSGGALVALGFILGPIVWYVAWNQALWGTWLGPKV
ncbi:MAG TPA: UbiA family prenyltransferase [Candidatus Thermoplasmatota archaeon]|nr:UbiA family prenyltransferase [Candidatus Thermoplasmatota archaeon]